MPPTSNALSQQLLFQKGLSPAATTDARSSTFADNSRLPVHHWFRFPAGFSALWANSVIAQHASERPTKVFDPFAGSGTTLVAAQELGIESSGTESHPFLFQVASAKLACTSNVDEFRSLVRDIRSFASRPAADLERYPTLIRKCFDDASLSELDALRQAVQARSSDSAASRLAWLALVSILRRCSHVGTASWQYVLPKKSKKKVLKPLAAFDELTSAMVDDMRQLSKGCDARLFQADARDCKPVEDGFANLVITSPPYPNNFDYADSTRLEMSFLGDIRGWGDLQLSVRQYLVRSCSQHVPERTINLPDVLAASELAPIRSELREVCERLAEIRLTKGGKKTYHLMVACYFYDLAKVWLALRRVCDSPAHVCFVIGDSAPYGIYVPVIEWLGKLALAAGFDSHHFERTRDRNVKWKNRKHRVPLCEGRLWVKG